MTTARGQIKREDESPDSQDLYLYIFAVVAGAFAGWVGIRVGDLLFTALLVLAPCMLLGVLGPKKPWRWVVLVGIFVPIAELCAYVAMTQKPYRSRIYESFLAFLPGIAGAYGGSLMRGVINNLRAGK